MNPHVILQTTLSGSYRDGEHTFVAEEHDVIRMIIRPGLDLEIDIAAISETGIDELAEFFLAEIPHTIQEGSVIQNAIRLLRNAYKEHPQNVL